MAESLKMKQSPVEPHVSAQRETGSMQSARSPPIDRIGLYQTSALCFNLLAPKPCLPATTPFK